MIQHIIYHFEQDWFPIAVKDNEAALVKRYLGDYVSGSPSKFEDRPTLLTKKEGAKLPLYIEMFFYKTMYFETKAYLNKVEGHIYEFIQNVY